MEQLELLWNYQRYDKMMDEYEGKRKNSPIRNKLIRIMNYLKEQQNSLVKLNDEADKKNHIFNRIIHEFESISNSIKTDGEWLKKSDVKSIKQLDQIGKNMQLQKDKLSRKRNELNSLLKEIEEINKKLRKISLNVTRKKKEYAKVKEEYDAVVEELKAKYREAKENRDQIMDKIDKNLLSKYNSLKASHSMVVATIDEDRCGGCNMSLASLVVKNVKDQKKIVECENCGRILYVGPKCN